MRSEIRTSNVLRLLKGFRLSCHVIFQLRRYLLLLMIIAGSFLKRKKLLKGKGRSYGADEVVFFWHHNHNNQHQKSKESREVALATIASKLGKDEADYIRGYNPSEKLAKTVRKATLQWTGAQARELVTDEVVRRL